MAKIKINFTCDSCGYVSPKWLGKCPDCQQWNTFVEGEAQKKSSHSFSDKSNLTKPKTIQEIQTQSFTRFLTHIEEFDRVMGGGITKGSLTLIGGEPGIGKSTLLMEVCGKLLSNKEAETILYSSGEESDAQIADRCKRLGINSDKLYILNQNNWEKILESIKEIKPQFFVLDSIQTTTSSELDSPSGTLSQIREVTYELMHYAKANDLTCFIIGHVTKDGQIAGPKVLEHMVDTVIYFEGDTQGQYRMLRGMKNRFGNTHEVGIFEMLEDGLSEVKNPSQYFLEQSLGDSFGRSLTCILEGSRALFVEIQALVVENKFSQGRRTTQGLDNNRVALLVAVIDKYLGLPLSYNDIYVNIVGGLKLVSRESDLAIIASLLSSFFQKPIPMGAVFLGEVGLTGEVRSIPMMELRLREIQQLNYEKVFVSKQVYEKYQSKFKIKLIPLERATDLKKIIFS